jgi:pyruvate dehydrogenase E1 component alpha subunit
MMVAHFKFVVNNFEGHDVPQRSEMLLGKRQTAEYAESELSAGSHLATPDYLKIYRNMLLSRGFDRQCNAILSTGKIVPHFHSGVGQEALMVASVASLHPTDQMIYTHRGYGHLLAKGVSLREIALDTFMKAGGTNNGLGGNMHVARPDLGVPGREGVFGTRFGIAVGLALAAKLDGSDRVTVCFYGEAAGARGIIYESLNMAVLWQLPIVYIAENNGWSFSSRTEWLFPESRMSRVWRGFEIPVGEFDGNDPEATYQVVSAAVAHARAGRGPAVVEGLTYRLDPHIWYDRAEYQPKDEIESWKRRDPLIIARQQLLARGVSEPELDDIAASAEGEVEGVFRLVQQAPDASWADCGAVVVS